MVGQDFIQLPLMSSSSDRRAAMSRSARRTFMTDIQEFVDRYVNIWNEPDAERRRQTIRALWQEDARHLARTIEAVGYDGIETRVKTAYEKWVKEKGNIFRLRDGVDSHHDTIKLRWEMLPAAGGEVISIGFDFLVVGGDGPTRTRYQFIRTPRRTSSAPRSGRSASYRPCGA